MPDNKIVVTKEQIEKAMACETAEELMALAKEVGIELTKRKPRRIWRSWKTSSWTAIR